MAKGKKITLSPHFEPENTTLTDVTWSSSDPSIVTVDADTGICTGIAAGNAIITITSKSDPSVTKDCQVEVYSLENYQIKLNSEDDNTYDISGDTENLDWKWTVTHADSKYFPYDPSEGEIYLDPVDSTVLKIDNLNKTVDILTTGSTGIEAREDGFVWYAFIDSDGNVQYGKSSWSGTGTLISTKDSCTIKVADSQLLKSIYIYDYTYNEKVIGSSVFVDKTLDLGETITCTFYLDPVTADEIDYGEDAFSVTVYNVYRYTGSDSSISKIQAGTVQAEKTYTQKDILSGSLDELTGQTFTWKMATDGSGKLTVTIKSDSERIYDFNLRITNKNGTLIKSPSFIIKYVDSDS